MADRRMFASQIVESDAFTDMPISAQALYFHMGMNADDDGFINNAKKVITIIGASKEDLSILIDKRFVLAFPSGVYVVKHWRMANSIQKDRYRPTVYEEEMASLVIKENKAYTEKTKGEVSFDSKVPESSETSSAKACFQGSEKPVSKVPESSETQLDKDSIDKDSINKNSVRAVKHPVTRFVPPSLDEVKDYCRERKSTVNPVKFFEYYSAGHWIDSKGQPVRNWRQKLITWEKKEEERNGRKSSTDKSISGKDKGSDESSSGEDGWFHYDA